MSKAKEFTRSWLRSRLGVEVGGYRHTIPARRQQLLDHFGIQLLVDVGANVGQYAREARRGGYAHSILSVEPVPAAFRELERVSAEDAAWEVRQVAIGSAPGTLTIHISEGSIFSSPLAVLDRTTTASPNARQIEDVDVLATTLDELVPRSDVPTAIKIDVQGFERDVLIGGSDALAHAKLVELELSPQPIYEGQMLMIETVERMQSAGFVLSLTENLFPEWETGRSLQFNGIFVRP